MRKLFILPILIILLEYCKNHDKNNSYTLEPIKDSIYIKLGKNEINHSNCIQFFSEKGTDYLAVKNKKRNSIFFYNLHSQKFDKEITIEEEGTNSFPRFISFFIKNMDSVFIISPMPGNIGILDNNGILKKKISLIKDQKGTPLSPSFSFFGQKAALINNNLFLLQSHKAFDYKGEFTSQMRYQSDIALSINLDNDSVSSIPLKYPSDLIGKDIFDMKNLWECGHNGCFIYANTIMDCLFVTKNFSEFRKIPIHSNYKLKLPENMSKLGGSTNGYFEYYSMRDNLLALFYDKYRECYYLLIQKRLDEITPEGTSATNFLYPDCVIVILDKNFNHMGDVHFPKNTYSFKDMFITKEGIYISEDHVNNPTYSEDAMRFRLFNLKKIDK